MVDIKVNGEEYAKALESVVIPYMKNYGLNQIVSDGSGCGHVQKVKDLLNLNGINLYPLAREQIGG